MADFDLNDEDFITDRIDPENADYLVKSWKESLEPDTNYEDEILKRNGF